MHPYGCQINKMKMKKVNNMRTIGNLMLTLSVCALAASCVRDEIVELPMKYGDSIRFGSTAMNETSKQQTKSGTSSEEYVLKGDDADFSATVTVIDGIAGTERMQPATKGTQVAEAATVQAFDVAAYFYQDGATTGGADYFTDTVNDGENPGTERYWPELGTLDFFAAYPAGLIRTMPTASQYESGFSFTYDINGTVAEQKDIMVATAKGLNNHDSGAAVPLNFQHLLAAVQFKVGEMYACKVESIEVSGVYGGTITFTYDKTNDIWTSTTPTTTTSYTPVLTVNTSNLDMGADITGNADGTMLLVAPQTTPAGATLTVKYYDLLVSDENLKTKSASLAGHNWAMGKTTAYSLNIDTELSVTIPRPDDQDAHYVMVDLAYDLGQISSSVTNLTASVEYINNTASTTIKPSLKMIGDLTTLQSQRYWTETQYTATETTNEDGTTTTSYTDPVNIRGSETLALTSTSGTIVMFLPENNGTTDRDVVLRITGTYNGETINIGSGAFTQLCPCWNDKGIGVERIEDKGADGNILTFPWGFQWTRKAQYKFEGPNIFLPYVFERQFSYEGSYYDIDVTDYYYFYKIWVVDIDYSSLNVVSGANSDDGLQNTKDLFNNTGTAGGVAEMENFCIDYTSLIGGKFELKSSSGSNEIPEDYAAYEALKRNRFTEILQINEDNSVVFPTIFEADMQWYLPSKSEAEYLVETGTKANGVASNVITPMDGIYWSSNVGTSTTDNTKAYMYKYNAFEASEDDRMESHRVRAVRKAN